MAIWGGGVNITQEKLLIDLGLDHSKFLSQWSSKQLISFAESLVGASSWEFCFHLYNSMPFAIVCSYLIFISHTRVLFFETTSPCLLRSSFNSHHLEKPRTQSAQKFLYNKGSAKVHTVSNAE